MEKKELRRQCFAAVKALSPEEREEASRDIRRQLREDPCFQAARTVFAFLPLASEPDLLPLFAKTPEKTWAFSRVLGKTIEFRVVRDLADTREGEWKIREPDPERCPLVEPDDATIILIPGVAFNPSTGDRLGRGKGHYDRYLGSRVARRQGDFPFLAGVCFSVQLHEWKTEGHDIAMDKVFFDQP